jgi:hypothetical protein
MPERAIVSLNGTSICLWLVNLFFLYDSSVWRCFDCWVKENRL